METSLQEPHNRSGRFGEEKNLVPLPGPEPRSLDSSACSPVTVLPRISGPICWFLAPHIFIELSSIGRGRLPGQVTVICATIQGGQTLHYSKYMTGEDFILLYGFFFFYWLLQPTCGF